MALSPWKALSSYKWLFILLISANIAITSACHTEVSQQKQVAKYPVVPCRVIQHMTGETCVPYRSKRIATLYTPVLANVLALGIKPIAITQATGTFEAFPPYLKDKVNGIELVATAGDVINLEKLLNLKPDLILGWDHHISVYPLLSRISPTLLPQSSVEASGENWKEYLRFLAEALEKQDAAQQILSNYDQRIEDLKVALGNRYFNKTISVAHISREYGVEAYVKNSFAGSILFNAGLKRPNSQDIIAQPRGTIEAISIEKLALIDGDILFVLIFNEEDREALDDQLHNSLWKKLKAVQHGNVHFVDGWTWSVENPLAANAVIDDLFKYLVHTP